MNEGETPDGASVNRITAEIRTLIADIIEIPEADIKDESSLGDLGADSLMAFEIVASIEKKYRIHVPEEEVQRVKTFADTIALVKEHLARAGG